MSTPKLSLTFATLLAASALTGCPEPSASAPAAPTPTAPTAPDPAPEAAPPVAAPPAGDRVPVARPGEVDKAAFEKKVGEDLKEAEKK